MLRTLEILSKTEVLVYLRLLRMPPKHGKSVVPGNTDFGQIPARSVRAAIYDLAEHGLIKLSYDKTKRTIEVL